MVVVAALPLLLTDKRCVFDELPHAAVAKATARHTATSRARQTCGPADGSMSASHNAQYPSFGSPGLRASSVTANQTPIALYAYGPSR